MQSNTGVLANQNFAANGVYDPNLTGTGHQPMFMDQLFAIYNHAYVAGSKIKVTFLPGVSNIVPVAVGVFLNDDVSAPSTSYTGYSEQTQSKMKIISAVDDAKQTITASYSSARTFGKGLLANNDLRNSASANPAELSVYTVFLQSLDLTATTNVYVWVEIEYICVFTELKDFAQS